MNDLSVFLSSITALHVNSSDVVRLGNNSYHVGTQALRLTPLRDVAEHEVLEVKLEDMLTKVDPNQTLASVPVIYTGIRLFEKGRRLESDAVQVDNQDPGSDPERLMANTTLLFPLFSSDLSLNHTTFSGGRVSYEISNQLKKLSRARVPGSTTRRGLLVNYPVYDNGKVVDGILDFVDVPKALRDPGAFHIRIKDIYNSEGGKEFLSRFFGVLRTRLREEFNREWLKSHLTIDGSGPVYHVILVPSKTQGIYSTRLESVKDSRFASMGLLQEPAYLERVHHVLRERFVSYVPKK